MLGVFPDTIHLIKQVICRVEIPLVRVLCSVLLPLAGSWQPFFAQTGFGLRGGSSLQGRGAPPNQPVFAAWPRNGETATEEPRAQVEGAVFMKDGSVNRQLLWLSQLKSSSQYCTPGQFLLNKSCTNPVLTKYCQWEEGLLCHLSSAGLIEVPNQPLNYRENF